MKLELVDKEVVETQEDLSRKLSERGFMVTQATISRDIKELRLVKVTSNSGRHKYAASSVSQDSGFSSRLRTIFRESVTKIESAQNIVVIKTLPGLAPAACSAIDSMNLSYVVGTLAGDDTAFLVIRDSVKAASFVEEINAIFE
jgi:transcriptional regulator of arginine metabolism